MPLSEQLLERPLVQLWGPQSALRSAPVLGQPWGPLSERLLERPLVQLSVSR